MRFRYFIFILLISGPGLFAQDQLKIDSLRLRVESCKEDTSKINLINQLSWELSKKDVIQAIQTAQTALELSLSLKSPEYIAGSYVNLGNYLFRMGKYDEAMKNYLDGYEKSRKFNFPDPEISALNGLGIVKDRMGNYDEALEYYFKALNLYNECIEKGISLKRVKDSQALYNNIGNIYLSKNDLEAAASYYIKGLQLAEKKNDYQNIGNLANNLGKLEMQRGNFDSAFVYLARSLEAREAGKDQNGIAKSYYYLADYYSKTGNLDKAMDYARKSVNLSLQLNELHTTMTAYNFMYQISKLRNKPSEALEYLEIYKDLNDSLLNQGNVEHITRLQMEYEFDRLQTEKEISQKKLRMNYLLIIVGLISILIIMGLLVILAISRHKRISLEKGKLELDISVKNKELTTNVLYLLKKNELILDITNRLLNLKSKLKPENRDAVQRIIFDLQSISEPEVWDEFEYRFQKVHEDFYRNLKEKFPDLTPAEIKLAAFLRLNMTTKDIASITRQNINTLETARYRLRKKLGISNQEVNLVNFLLDI